MKLSHKAYQLPFKHPFTTSKGTKTHQPTLIVSLSHFGLQGFGEASAISYYDISVVEMIRDLEQHRASIERFSFTEPERFWHFLHHLIPQNPFLVCALDIAAWDLYGKLLKKPLYKIFNVNTALSPATDYTIGLDDVQTILDKIAQTPWPAYKVKLGTGQEVEIIKAIRSQTDAILRIDANAAWSLDQAMNLISEFQRFNIEFIEQPLAKDNWEGMKGLLKNTSIPLIADESCVLEHDVKKCFEHFSGINIKLTKCSGITPAIRMIDKARGLGLKTMLGCMNESTIGTAALAHLAPLVDYMDADGPLLLAEDLASGLEYDQGKIKVSEEPGLGISVFENI